jgi:Bacterial Ig-like domain (group 3)/FG-GAP-like repeat
MEFESVMNRRTTSLLALVAVALLTSFSSAGQLNSQPRIDAAVKSATGTALKKVSARMKTPAPPVSNIGFLSAPQIPMGGYDHTTYFPAVSGDFDGDGNKDAATVVKSTGKYYISSVLGKGDGTFSAPNLTLTTATAADPIWVGDLKGDGKDDLVMGHQGSHNASFEVWLSKGDGTFASQGKVILPLTGSYVTWGALYLNPVSTHLDIVIADGVNNLIWTALGNGDGTFGTPTSVGFSPAIASNAPVAFADFDGDGNLDFAATDATTNQDEVFFGTGIAFSAPLLLTTPDGLYNSCFDAAGVLTSSGKPDIVSAGANCNLANLLANTLTVYVNTSTPGHGAFDQGVYYAVGIRPEALTIANTRGIGHPNDVVTVTTQPGDVKVLLGNGDGTLQTPAVGYATGGNVSTQPVVADFNNDQKADIIVSDRLFSLVYLQGYGDGSFRSAINYFAAPTGGGFHPNGVDIASGDFNGDGIPDFVIGNATNGGLISGITVFLSNADGGMQQGVPYTSNGSASSLQYVAVGDFNGDGKLDIAAADSTNGVVQIFNGNGNGTFTVGATYPTGTVASRSALGLVAGDFNGDGKLDLAVVNNYGGTTADVGVLINNGSGFNLANYTIGDGTILGTNITLADVNGDKKWDLLVPLYGTNATPGTAVAMLMGNGDGTFTAKPNFVLGFNNPLYAAVGDLNGDGIPDLAVTIDDQTTSTQGIAVAAGKGDGTFNPAQLIPSTLQPANFDVPLPGYVKMLDMDRDGHLDLVYTNTEFGTVGVLYGKGDGTFYDPLEFTAGHMAYGLALADVNKDGAVDAVATGNSAVFSGVTVLLNTSGDSVSSFTSSLPNAPFGVTVTFHTTIAGSKVHGVTAVPTGSVTFYDGSTALGTVPLSSDTAAFSTSTLSAGSHNITARYSGDVNFVPVTSGILVQVIAPPVIPSYTLTASPTTQTVNAGSSASYTISVNPTNGYNGTITFSCPASLPTGVTCVLPSPMAPPYTPATLVIKTAAPTSAMSVPANVNPNAGGSNLWASLGGLGMVGMILVGDWKKRNRRRMAIVLTVLTVAMILALVGCGGGSSSSSGGGGGGGTGGTPAGSYKVQVTATGTAGTNGGNTAPQPLNLTLVVN